MAEDETHLASVITVRNSIEASLLVGLLEADGIEARSTGDFTANLLVEALGGVQVMVREADLVRATEVLAELREDHDQQVSQGPEAAEWESDEQETFDKWPCFSHGKFWFWFVAIFIGWYLHPVAELLWNFLLVSFRSAADWLSTPFC